jgi:methanogenic corrinoid protein MtbC1
MSSVLSTAMADLNEDVVLAEIARLQGSGTPSLEIIGALQEGMAIVGQRFEEKDYFLSELIMSAEIFNEAGKLLGTEATDAAGTLGTLVLGTVHQDVHDIGKNIVRSVLASHGVKVIDLGVDVPAAKFLEAIREHRPAAVGISCLLTTCFGNVKACIEAIDAAGLRDGLKVLVGGGPLDEAAGRYVGADLVCKDAMIAVDWFKARAAAAV